MVNWGSTSTVRQKNDGDSSTAMPRLWLMEGWQADGSKNAKHPSFPTHPLHPSSDYSLARRCCCLMNLCGFVRRASFTHVCVLRAVLCNLNGSLFSRKWQLLVAVTPKNPVCHWEKWKHQRPRRSQLGWLFVMATARIGPIFLKIRKEIPPRGGGQTTYFACVWDLPRSAVKNTLRANIYYKFCK